MAGSSWTRRGGRRCSPLAASPRSLRRRCLLWLITWPATGSPIVPLTCTWKQARPVVPRTPRPPWPATWRCGDAGRPSAGWVSAWWARALRPSAGQQNWSPSGRPGGGGGPGDQAADFRAEKTSSIVRLGRPTQPRPARPAPPARAAGATGPVAVRSFVSAGKSVRKPLVSEDTVGAQADFHSATGLCQGEILADDPSEQWAEVARGRLRLAFRDGLDRLSRLRFDAG